MPGLPVKIRCKSELICKYPYVCATCRLCVDNGASCVCLVCTSAINIFNLLFMLSIILINKDSVYILNFSVFLLFVSKPGYIA